MSDCGDCSDCDCDCFDGCCDCDGGCCVGFCDCCEDVDKPRPKTFNDGEIPPYVVGRPLDENGLPIDRVITTQPVSSEPSVPVNTEDVGDASHDADKDDEKNKPDRDDKKKNNEGSNIGSEVADALLDDDDENNERNKDEEKKKKEGSNIGREVGDALLDDDDDHETIECASCYHRFDNGMAYYKCALTCSARIVLCENCYKAGDLPAAIWKHRNHMIQGSIGLSAGDIKALFPIPT